MIEIIVLILILTAIVGSLRKPRTFAELEYQTYVRRKRRKFVWGLLLVVTAFFGFVYIIGLQAP
jgi:hypothetical protein